LLQVLPDFVRVRFSDAFVGQLSLIGRHFRKNETGQRPAGPCSPCSQFLPGADHAGGEMLVVAAGVTYKVVGMSVLHDPGRRGIRERPAAGCRLSARQIRRKGAVD
jgi:hypothetical protein